MKASKSPSKASMMQSLTRVKTNRFILTAVLMLVTAGFCDILDRLTWHHSRLVSEFFDMAALILFWASYILLWALLVLGPFRPHAEFSLRGLCKSRAANFFLTLGALLLLHFWIAALAYTLL